jgi:hypothetical protein
LVTFLFFDLAGLESEQQNLVADLKAKDDEMAMLSEMLEISGTSVFCVII